MRRVLAVGLALTAAIACGPIGSTTDRNDGGPNGGGPDARPPLGCSEKHPAAPDGYYTSGSTVCTSDGRTHLFHGVDRPSFEWSAKGDHVSADDFGRMANDWRANVVRVALNQDFWLEGAALHDPLYRDRIDQAVHDAEAAGLDVILDLHWSDRGDLGVTKTGAQNTDGSSGQQQMADRNSIEFWKQVATKYKGDGRVLFELYNEPNEISWDVWLHGGNVEGYAAVGMQALYDAVRNVGADNLVIAGGVLWAYDLSLAGSDRIQGYNVMYATHPYDKPDNQPRGWDASWGYLASEDLAPVIVTEFGDGNDACTGEWNKSVIDYADAHRISWTAWAWYPAGCNFPSIIEDWSGTPTMQGQVIKDALLAYPPETRPSDAGVEAGTETGDADAGDGDAGDGETSD